MISSNHLPNLQVQYNSRGYQGHRGYQGYQGYLGYSSRSDNIPQNSWNYSISDLGSRIEQIYPDLSQHVSRRNLTHLLGFFYDPTNPEDSIERTMNYIGDFITQYRRTGVIPDPSLIGIQY
jgi:hypothetical protein